MGRKVVVVVQDWVKCLWFRLWRDGLGLGPKSGLRGVVGGSGLLFSASTASLPNKENAVIHMIRVGNCTIQFAFFCSDGRFSFRS